MRLTKKNWRGTKNCLKHCHMNALRTKSNYGMLQQIPYLFNSQQLQYRLWQRFYTTDITGRENIKFRHETNQNMKICISTWHTYSCQPTRAWQISVFSVKITLDIFGSKTGHNRDTLHMANLIGLYHHVIPLHGLLNVL